MKNAALIFATILIAAPAGAADPNAQGLLAGSIAAVQRADWNTGERLAGAALQAGALRLGTTCARSVAAALLARHATWAQRHRNDATSSNALRRFCAHGLDRIIED